MKKRLFFLEILRKVLVGGEHGPNDAGGAQSGPKTTVVEKQTEFVDLEPTPGDLDVEAIGSIDIGNLPQVCQEIRDLLGSSEWEEVNQGLELLAASHQESELKALNGLIDIKHLQIREAVLWEETLGITEVNEINAVAKVASLTGGLDKVTRIELNSAYFANSELVIDLDLLSEASSLKELIINGIRVQNPGRVSELTRLRSLVLPDDLEWDEGEDAECFKDMVQLEMLSIGTWPWEVLNPLENCRSIKRLRIRGGELATLEGINCLTSLESLELKDCYNLNELTGVESLEGLETLVISGGSFGEISSLSNLKQLRSVTLEGPDMLNLSTLGELQSLEKVELNCTEVEGLGALAYCSQLVHLKFFDSVPAIKCTTDIPLKEVKIENLLSYWKRATDKTDRISERYAKGVDSIILVLAINILEYLAGQISLETFKERGCRIGQNQLTELRKRCYWPWVERPRHGFSHTHPIGLWLEQARLAGMLSEESCNEFSIALSELLPEAPQR